MTAPIISPPRPTCPAHPGRLQPCEICQPEERAALRRQKEMTMQDTATQPTLDQEPEQAPPVDPYADITLGEEDDEPTLLDLVGDFVKAIATQEGWDVDDGDRQLGVGQENGLVTVSFGETLVIAIRDDIEEGDLFPAIEDQVLAYIRDHHEAPLVEAPRTNVQPTLDDALFRPFHVPLVRVNFSGGIELTLATLREMLAKSVEDGGSAAITPGLDVTVTLQGYISGAGLKWSRSGAGKAGAINVSLEELLEIVIFPTSYTVAEKAEAAGGADTDEDGVKVGEDPGLDVVADALLDGQVTVDEALAMVDGEEGDVAAD